jgi:putative oxidoreductase
MSRTQGTQDLGKAILRIVLGVLILLHGIAKVMAGPGFVVQVVTQAGLPRRWPIWSISARWSRQSC